MILLKWSSVYSQESWGYVAGGAGVEMGSSGLLIIFIFDRLEPLCRLVHLEPVVTQGSPSAPRLLSTDRQTNKHSKQATGEGTSVFTVTRAVK